LRKCGPNYRVKYCEVEFDFFAVYDLNNDRLYLVPSAILQRYDNAFGLRVEASKNNQKQKVNQAEDYLAEKVLRDYTGSTPPDNAEGDDIVQTATLGQGNLVR